MLLSAVFLILFTAWMLWGWIVGESRDIRWMRNWCAGIFVVVIIVICLGSGAWITRRVIQADHRDSVKRLAQLLLDRMQEERINDVRDALHHLAEGPDEGSAHSGDVLIRVVDVTEALEKTARTRVAGASSANAIE